LLVVEAEAEQMELRAVVEELEVFLPQHLMLLQLKHTL
jgi:hypothetical protein